jgi:predicted Ser/Thr protein kinase
MNDLKEDLQEAPNSENINRALDNLERSLQNQEHAEYITFNDFLKETLDDPGRVIRNVFQVFHDMVKAYVGEGKDEYPDDPESINFVFYDCEKLFVEDVDHPFFADRIFANRLMAHAESLKLGAQQNKIYIFEGPHGCGKSTFLNNLLLKFERYANTYYGMRYEVLWRLGRKELGDSEKMSPLMKRMFHIMNYPESIPDDPEAAAANLSSSQLEMNRRAFEASFEKDIIDVPCPSHDHPIVMIPKEIRRNFLDDVFENAEFKYKLFTEKEYDWVFRQTPCTFCQSLYDALLRRLKSPLKVFEMIYARPYRVIRRQGEGVSVYNPGDKPIRMSVMTNPLLQRRIDMLFEDSNTARYIYSRYAKTNNGIYALMDIKSHNTERLIELHNIISEGVHKVEDIEENVDSLFFALMNPEDKKNIAGMESFSDRIDYINLPYVMDLKTEVAIYRNIFGNHIDDRFLPRVLHNFARVIISSRLNQRSDALLEWIKAPNKYEMYCDKNLQLLKMEIYTGHIPPWLTEEDRKAFTAKRRRRIIAESKNEGQKGLSGRDSIKIFNDFFSAYAKEDRLINMSTLCNYFKKVRKELMKEIPDGFIESLQCMYDYTILQEVKESLYYYNEEQIARDTQNYIFAVNFEVGATQTCVYTGERIDITEDFFGAIEQRLLGNKATETTKKAFRKEVQKEYASQTLTQEIMVEGKSIGDTQLFKDLHDRYVYFIKQKVLDPFLENENFRQAIKNYAEEEFKTFDKKIQADVTFLINNLCNRCGYAENGAKEVCMYVIDNDIAKKFN